MSGDDDQPLGTRISTDHLPLLRWLMFTGVSAFGFVLAWHFGLFHLMLASDKTYISAIITVLYVVISLHCFVRTAAISRELDSAQRVFALVSRGTSGFRVIGHRRGDRRRDPAAAGPGHRAHPQPHSQGRACRGASGSTRPCCCAGWRMRCAGPTSSARSPAMR